MKSIHCKIFGVICLLLGGVFLIFQVPLLATETSVRAMAPDAIKNIAKQPAYNIDVRIPNLCWAPCSPFYVTAYFETKEPISNSDWEPASGDLPSHSEPYVHSQWPEINQAFKQKVQDKDLSHLADLGTLLTDASGLKHVFVCSPVSFSVIRMIAQKSAPLVEH